MHSNLTQALAKMEFKDLFSFLMNHQGSLTDAFAPEQIPMLTGMGHENGIPETRAYEAIEWTWNSDLEPGEQSQLAGLLMYRLQHDEAALNWGVHDILCHHHVAGSDAYLFDLIRELSVAEKLAICAARCKFWGSKEIKSLHLPGLTSAIDSIALFCEGSNTTRIEWLPTNENLLQIPVDSTLCSIGKMGASAVLLEASPLNTLPKSLLIEYSDLFDSENRERYAARYQKWPIASQLWMKVIFGMGSQVLDDIQNLPADELEFDLDELAKACTGGMADWGSLSQCNWNSYYPSTWADQQDFAKAAYLLHLRPYVGEDCFEQIRDVVARFYHVSDIEKGYAGGFPETEKVVKLIEDCPVDGLGKLMFKGEDRDPLQIIDQHLESHKDLIASSLISRSFSSCYSYPKAGIDLLCIINHDDPDKRTGLYDYAIVKMQLQTLRFLKENEPQEDVLEVMGCVRALLSNAHDTIDNPWPSAPALEQAYAVMPLHLQGPEARLSLGLNLTREQMQQVDKKLRDSSFNIDLGL